MWHIVTGISRESLMWSAMTEIFREADVISVTRNTSQQKLLCSLNFFVLKNIWIALSAVGYHYAMSEMEFFDEERITNFVESVVNGTAKIRYKSQPVPTRQDGPVTRIVGKNFREMVRFISHQNKQFYCSWWQFHVLLAFRSPTVQTMCL